MGKEVALGKKKHSQFKITHEKLKMCTKGRKTTSTFFVPPSRNSNLYKFVMEREESLHEKTSWSTKVLEQSGCLY